MDFVERLLAEKDKFGRCCPCPTGASEAEKRSWLDQVLGMEKGAEGLMQSTDLCGGAGYASE